MCPKISYLVSTYNTPSFLDKHIPDLLYNQTDPNFEIIVINPTSPSYDGDVADKWVKKDSRVRLLTTPDYGSYGSAWLNGWKIAEGEYIVNSNVDDSHFPRFTEVFYNTMQTLSLRSDAPYWFCYAGWQVVDKNGNLMHQALKPPFNYERFKYECTAGPQVCWSNSLEFKAVLDWDLMWKRALEHQSAWDYWAWLYFLNIGAKGYTIPEILTIYMQRVDSIENRSPQKNTFEALSSIAEFFPNSLPSEFPEFKDFNNLPPKEEWIAKRKKGEAWTK